jgi:hypothetical protein
VTNGDDGGIGGLPSDMPPMPAAAPTGRTFGRPSNYHDAVGAALPASNQADAAAKRSPVLVWIVFYWIISGVMTTIGSLMMMLAAGAMLGAVSGMGDAFHSPHVAEGAIAAEFISLLFLLLFHVGLFTMVTCYGLWTFRKWGLLLARILAAVYSVGGLITLIVAVVMRSGLVASLTNFGISIAILIYFFGRANLSEQLHKVVSRVRQTDEPDWNQYQ